LQKDKKMSALVVRKSPTMTSGLCRVLRRVSVRKSIHGLRTAQAEASVVIKIHKEFTKEKRGLRQGGKEGFKTSAHIPLPAHTPAAMKSSSGLPFLGIFCRAWPAAAGARKCERPLPKMLNVRALNKKDGLRSGGGE